MAVLRPRNIDQKAEDRRNVGPVREGFARPDRNAEGRDGVGKQPRHRSPSRGSAAKNCERRLHEHAEDNRLDQHIDHHSVDLV